MKIIQRILLMFSVLFINPIVCNDSLEKESYVHLQNQVEEFYALFAKFKSFDKGPEIQAQFIEFLETGLKFELVSEDKSSNFFVEQKKRFAELIRSNPAILNLYQLFHYILLNETYYCCEQQKIELNENSRNAIKSISVSILETHIAKMKSIIEN